MKKLIAISVVFALAAGVAFAVDVGGSVIGTINLVKTDSADGTPVTADGGLDRLRLDGGGEVADGKFGGYIRLEESAFAGNAWWKPIDQLKITIGGNPDGFWDKNGVAGWMFYQSASDTGVADSGENTWGGGGVYDQGLKYRNAFYKGFSENGLLLEIKPFDVLGINIGIPFFRGGEYSDIIKGLVAQVDLNFSFGNIAITYEVEGSYIQGGNVNWLGGDGGVIYGYFGLTAIENMNLDVGFGIQFNDEDGTKNPFVIGLGFKYAVGGFAVKFRTALSIPGETTQNFKVLADVLPYYTVNENLRIYLSAGLGIMAASESQNADSWASNLVKAQVGWRVNPYVEVGGEWGPKFLAGIKLDSSGIGIGQPDDTKAVVNFSIPIALAVSF